ncbi:flagellar basal-body MS-ring/collar protein FliF [Halomonas sp. WWR20]
MSTAASANDTSQGQATQAAASPTQGGANQWLTQLRNNSRLPLIIAGAAAVAIVIALLMWARSPDYRVLYSTLTDADGGQIIAELDSLGVPYQFSDSGQALLVPADQVHSLRLKLAEQGLPQAGGVGFELMDSQAFGISQFAEHINYQRALEGELARSVETLGPVQKARVHLAMAKPSVFVRERQPASASVMLELQPGRVMGDGQVNAIVHMVSSSVPELAAEDVTVVDQTGRLLSRPSGDGLQLNGTQLSYITEVERSYQRRIEAILAPIMGAQNIKAQVAAQIDFSHREQTAERYNPNQAPAAAAIRSQQNSEAFQSRADTAMGVPGALSNQAPGVAPSPIDNGVAPEEEDGDGDAEGEADTEATTADAQNLGQLRRENTINYEVDRTVEHVQQRSGNIERLSVAVVVNYRTTLDDEGQPVRKPLSDAELAQVEQLVRQAMGYSEARGDAIAVVNSQFTEPQSDDANVDWWKTPQAIEMAMTLGRYLLVALVALFLWFKIVRPLVQRHTRAPAPATPVFTPAPDIREVADENAAATDLYDRGEPKRKRNKSASYEQNLKDAREMAQEDPRLVAMIVRGWVSKHD